MNNKNDIKKILTIILILLISYLCITNIKYIEIFITKMFKALFPFFLGIILAFVLNILMTKIEKLLNKIKFLKKKELKRFISILLSLTIFILIILFICLELIPELINNIESLIKSIPNILLNLESKLLNILKDYPDIQTKIINIFNDSGNINKIILNILNYLLNSSISFISTFISSIITLFTSLVFAIYMLSQKEYLINGINKVLKAYLNKNIINKINSVAKLTNKTFSNFVSGQCLEALILGIIFFIVLSIFKFPYALLISVLTTITALIPIFGALIAMVIGAILIATISPIKALIFIIIFITIQQIENNLIYPKVVGKSVGLSPIWTLLSITLGGSLFGIIGMLIGLPLASILYALLKKDINNRLNN